MPGRVSPARSRCRHSLADVGDLGAVAAGRCPDAPECPFGGDPDPLGEDTLGLLDDDTAATRHDHRPYATRGRRETMLMALADRWRLPCMRSWCSGTRRGPSCSPERPRWPMRCGPRSARRRAASYRSNWTYSTTSARTAGHQRSSSEGLLGVLPTRDTSIAGEQQPPRRPRSDERGEMIEIDGSRYAGSGSIVRQAVAYAALTGQAVEVSIRGVRG